MLQSCLVRAHPRLFVARFVASAAEGLRDTSAWGVPVRTNCNRFVADLQTTEDADDIDPSEINVEAHFSVIDAFDMPPIHFDSVRAGFTTYVTYFNSMTHG